MEQDEIDEQKEKKSPRHLPRDSPLLPLLRLPPQDQQCYGAKEHHDRTNYGCGNTAEQTVIATSIHGTAILFSSLVQSYLLIQRNR
ncbi:hypothetical protein CAEBREN_09412 [Caenorhabditis brenneri]|uniref:Uncharacterized protein n=1 Tax=Caenorhabditis brenneri TaxID=135651 RepID=G0NV26_CAEBE|nr:hypothetical protein CAEBREN_09412 [Caenorhabditis brenneri]